MAHAPTSAAEAPATLGAGTVVVSVSWPAATDANGISRYELQHRVGAGNYSDVTLPSPTAVEANVSLVPGPAAYSFRLRAVDLAGNASEWMAGEPFQLVTLQETDTRLVFTGSWTAMNVSGASGGAVKYASASTSKVVHSFTGQGVAVVAAKGSNRGKAGIYLDGLLVQTVDLYAPSTSLGQVVYSASFAESGAHILEIRVLGTKRSASSGTRVDIDALIVMQPPDTTDPETRIDLGPIATSPSPDASVTFSANEIGATFECALDGAAFAACVSPAMYSGLANGPHNFQVRATDAAGNVDETPASHSWTVAVDATAPTVSAPAAALEASTLGTSTVPVRVSWPAANDANGIARYELQGNANGGAYADVPLASPTALQATAPVPSGSSTYTFRVRAFDPAGNASPWAVGEPFKLALSQENFAALVFGGSWTRTTLSGASGGSVKHASAATAKMTHTFTGRGYALTMAKGANRGKAAIYLDGALVSTVDLYASSVQARAIGYAVTFASSGTHTIEVRVLGTKRAASSGTRVDVDAVVVMQ